MTPTTMGPTQTRTCARGCGRDAAAGSDWCETCGAEVNRILAEQHERAVREAAEMPAQARVPDADEGLQTTLRRVVDIASRQQRPPPQPLDERPRRLAELDGRLDLEFAEFVGVHLEWPEVGEWLTDLSQHGWRTRETHWRGLLLAGKAGTGKTGNAVGALRDAVRAGFAGTSDWIVVPDLLFGMSLDRQRERIDELGRADFAILDDLRPPTENSKGWVEEQFLRLLDMRWRRCLSTVLTTNLKPDDLTAVFGARVMSRLSSFRWVLKGGPDRRRKQ